MLILKNRSNVREVRADVEDTRRGARSALVAALNVVATTIESVGGEEILTRYRMKPTSVTRAFRLVLATPNTLSIVVSVAGYALSVAGFMARQERTGVSVDIKGQRKIIRGAFAQTMRSSRGDEYQVVFMRKGKDRYPIKALKTVDVPGAFNRTDVQQIVDERAFSRFQEELSRRIDGVTSRMNRD